MDQNLNNIENFKCCLCDKFQSENANSLEIHIDEAHSEICRKSTKENEHNKENENHNASSEATDRIKTNENDKYTETSMLKINESEAKFKAGIQNCSEFDGSITDPAIELPQTSSHGERGLYSTSTAGRKKQLTFKRQMTSERDLEPESSNGMEVKKWLTDVIATIFISFKRRRVKRQHLCF